MIEPLPSMCEFLGLIPSTKKYMELPINTFVIKVEIEI